MLKKGTYEEELKEPSLVSIICPEDIIDAFVAHADGSFTVLDKLPVPYLKIRQKVRAGMLTVKASKSSIPFDISARPVRDPQIPDPDPVEVPVPDMRETWQTRLADAVRAEIARQRDTSIETMAEANDFDVVDPDGDFQSPYELMEMSEDEPAPEAPAPDEKPPEAPEPPKDPPKGDPPAPKEE